MAQNIKLKRSAVPGKVPSTAQLEAGEIAINTADGKLYFERDDSTIQTIVTTNAVVTGSLNINGSITGSDVQIGGWGSVSASLASNNSLTLQQVTSNGNTTTNSISVAGITNNGNLFLSGSNRLVYNNSVSSSLLFGFFDGSAIYGPYYQIFGNSYSDLTQRGSAEYVYDTRNGGASGFNVVSFNGLGWTRKFRVDDNGVQITGSAIATGGFTGSLYGTASWAVNTLTAISTSYAATASSADSFTIRTALTASGLRYPTTDGVFSGQVLQTNAAGTLSFGNVAAVFEDIYNAEATTVVKGTALYVSGSQGATPKVYRADAADPTRMPVTFVAMENIGAGAVGRGITLGLITGIDMTGYAVGENLYVNGNGVLTSTRPTGSNDIVQPIGIVTKPGNGGQLNVLNPGPVILPNLISGSAWVGNSTNFPVAVPTASFLVTQAVSSSLAALATTASYALKAESVGQLNQNVVINGNLQVFGTSSFTYVTSSQLNVDDSFISVNIFEPAERFGGLKVYDSGSSNATASLAWDSLHNHWVYQNATGSMYTGGMLLSGPRNTGSLGDEPNLTKWFVPRSDGGDHLDNSQIFSSGSTTIITGSLTTTGKVTINTVDNYGSDPDKFLAIVSGEVVYRTGAQVLSEPATSCAMLIQTAQLLLQSMKILPVISVLRKLLREQP